MVPYPGEESYMNWEKFCAYSSENSVLLKCWFSDHSLESFQLSPLLTPNTDPSNLCWLCISSQCINSPLAFIFLSRSELPSYASWWNNRCVATLISSAGAEASMSWWNNRYVTILIPPVPWSWSSQVSCFWLQAVSIPPPLPVCHQLQRVRKYNGDLDLMVFHFSNFCPKLSRCPLCLPCNPHHFIHLLLWDLCYCPTLSTAHSQLPLTFSSGAFPVAIAF